MLKNYVKTSLRNLFKYRGYSLINIAGLAIGMASCLLILLYVQHELSYDSFNEKADQIYRVAGSYRYGGRDFEIAVNPAALAEVMIKDYPEVIDAVRFFSFGDFIIQHKDNSFKETSLLVAALKILDVEYKVPQEVERGSSERPDRRSMRSDERSFGAAYYGNYAHASTRPGPRSETRGRPV